MKRSSCISNIKNQISAKINSQTDSDRDYIVFRPKSYVFNPILTKKDVNMKSIFQLEGKRKNQSSLMKFRYQSNQRSDPNEEIQNHLKIQKCKTAKKFRLNYKKFTNSKKAFELVTPREKKNIKTLMQKLGGLKSTCTIRSEKNSTHEVMPGLQKKKNIGLFFIDSKNNKSMEQKENFPKTSNFQRLKPVLNDEQFVDLSYLSLFKERMKENQKLRASVKKSNETHKRIFTEIPSILVPKSPQKSVKKCNKNYFYDQFQVKQKKVKNKIQQFQPWQTSQCCGLQDELLNQ